MTPNAMICKGYKHLYVSDCVSQSLAKLLKLLWTH